MYDHSLLLKKLLPPGLALDPEPNSNLSHLLDGMAGEFDRVAQQAENLIYESNPLTMSTMTPIRAKEAGLPWSCRGNFTFQRNDKADVIATWANRGGASIEYLTQLAKWYGYIVKIVEYPIFHIEQNAIESIGYDDEYSHAYQVNFAYVPTDLYHPFLIEVTQIESLGIDDGYYDTVTTPKPKYVRPTYYIEETAIETLGYDNYYEAEIDYKELLYAGTRPYSDIFPAYDIACIFNNLSAAHATATYYEWPIDTDIPNITPKWW